MAKETTTHGQGVAQQILAAAQRGQLALPPLPAVVTRLLDMLRDENRVDLGRVADLMQNDAAITASVLRIANSAFYGGLGETDTLNAAIQRLGLRQISMMVTSIAHKAHFHSASPTRLELLRRLWDHTLVSALAAQRLAGTHPVERTEAYLAGLMHDAGKLVVLRGLDEIEQRPNVPRFSIEDVEEMMEALHSVLGFSTLRAWRISDRICHVALHHHDSNVPAGDRLLLRIQVADVMARRLCSRWESEKTAGLPKTHAMTLLGLEDADLNAMMAEVEEEFARARGLFE